MLILIYITAAALISSCLTYGLSRRDINGFRDVPNHRSLHAHTVPRSGGIGIAATLFLVFGVVFFLQGLSGWDYIPLIAGFGLTVFVSLVDDWQGLSQSYRLLVHGIAGASVIYYFGQHGLFDDIQGLLAWFYPVSVMLLVVWSINLFNFMDGMDGFASGMAVIGFFTLGILGVARGEMVFAIVCYVIAAASAGFLVWNFPPARIFMGDTGSTLFGYLMAVISLYGIVGLLFPWWVPLVIFAPFWVDATVTLAKRMLAGKPIWQAHREHYYQRLVLAGYSHKTVVLWEYLLMILGAASVVINQKYLPEIGGFIPIIWLVIYIALILCLEWRLGQARSRLS